MIDKIPTVTELSRYPELAILDALERTLQLASSALIATYNDPDDVPPVEEDSTEEAYAHAVVNQMTALQLTLVRYRRAVECF
jgi:hypothetical protein